MEYGFPGSSPSTLPGDPNVYVGLQNSNVSASGLVGSCRSQDKGGVDQRVARPEV